MDDNSITDLDNLYCMLRQKGKLTIEEISNYFKVPEDLAMSWAKTLESGKFATLSSPRFGKPTLVLNQEIQEDKKNFLIEKSYVKEPKPEKEPPHRINNKKPRILDVLGKLDETKNRDTAKIKEIKKEVYEKPKITENKENKNSENFGRIREENKKRMDEAAELVLKMREQGYDNKYIASLFKQQGWPEDVISDLIK